MTWNYRVIRRVHDKGGISLGIYEVYYDEKGEPFAISSEPDQAIAFVEFDEDEKEKEKEKETLQALKKTLEWMLQALERPVLDYDMDFADPPWKGDDERIPGDAVRKRK